MANRNADNENSSNDLEPPSSTPFAGRSQLAQIFVCSLISIPLAVVSGLLWNGLFDPPRGSIFWQMAAIAACCPFVVGIALHWPGQQPLSQRLVNGVGLGLLSVIVHSLLIFGAFAIWVFFFFAS